MLIGDYMNPLPINILNKTNTCILYEIQPGKPGKDQSCTIGQDTRDRVMQSAVKGNACWYFTFNFLRQRIGKNPCEQLVECREIEQKCSARHKAQIENHKSLPYLATRLQTEENIDLMQGITKKNVDYYLSDKAIFETPEGLNGRPSFYPYIVEFKEQNKYKNTPEEISTHGVLVLNAFLRLI